MAYGDYASSSLTINANSYLVIEYTVTKSGYTPIGIIRSNCHASGPSGGMTYASITDDATKIVTVWRNFTSYAFTDKYLIRVLYLKQ